MLILLHMEMESISKVRRGNDRHSVKNRIFSLFSSIFLVHESLSDICVSDQNFQNAANISEYPSVGGQQVVNIFPGRRPPFYKFGKTGSIITCLTFFHYKGSDYYSLQKYFKTHTIY